MTQRRAFFSPCPFRPAALRGVFRRAAPAAAQLSGEVSAQRFDPAPGTKNSLNTRALRTDGDMVFGGGFMVNYGYRPIVVEGCERSVRRRRDADSDPRHREHGDGRHSGLAGDHADLAGEREGTGELATQRSGHQADGA